VGDVGGGTAISIPLDDLQQATGERWEIVLGTHFLIWIMGLFGLFVGFKLLTAESRKRAGVARDLEEALASTEAVLESLPVGVVLVGRDKVVRRINQTALEIIGKKERDVLGHICHQHICPAQEGQCPMLDLNTVVDNSEKIVLGSENRKIPVLKSVIPFVYKGENVLLEAFVDISERQESISRLTESMNDLKRFNSLAVDRELRMVELKSEINELLEEAGRQARYSVVTGSIPERTK